MDTRHPVLRLVPAAAIAAIVAACGSSSPSTAPSQAASPVAVTAAQAFISAGQQVQMSAVAGNRSLDVTATATWQSSNPSLMTVSATGLATALADGSVIVSATYQGVTGSRPLTIFPTEVCLSYNTGNLSVAPQADFWLLTDGVQNMVSLDTFADGVNALALARRYSSLCYIGRNNVRINRLAYIVNFWHGETGAVTSISPEDCTPFSPAALQVANLGATGWAVTDGAQQLALLETQADAVVAMAEAKRYTAQCFIGRQNPRPSPLSYTLQYWK